MTLKLAALSLIVVPCLLAGTGAKGCEPADCPAPAPAETAEEPEPPPGPARIVDEGFNEIAATDDDDRDLQAALLARHVRAEVLASRPVPADGARETGGPARSASAAAGPNLTVPALSAVGIVLLFMAGCVAMARYRPPDG